MENQGRSLLALTHWHQRLHLASSSHSAVERSVTIKRSRRDRDRTFIFPGSLSLEEVTVSAGIKDPISPENVHVVLIIHLLRMYVRASVCQSRVYPKTYQNTASRM